MILCFLMLVLTMSCLITLFFGLHDVLRRTSYARKRQKVIFRNTLIIVAGWLLLLAVSSWNGFFDTLSDLILAPALAFLLPLPVILTITFSKSFSRILYITPPTWLVYMQTFRIWVEIILWMGLIEKVLPKQMTFEGSNFDILTGITAPLIGFCCFVKKNWPPVIAVVWNVVGLLLLINILVIAVLAMPALITTFPFILLPGILVPIAYSMHVFSLRQLLQQKRIRAAANW